MPLTTFLIPSQRLRALLSLSTLIYTVSLLLGSRTLRAHLVSLFHPRTHPFRFTNLLLLTLLNFKSLPFIWHARVFGSMFEQLYKKRPALPKDALFRPVITAGMYTPLAECDWNLHKSNSTYFADFDVARTQLVTALLRKGITESSKAKNSRRQDTKPATRAVNQAVQNIQELEAEVVSKIEGQSDMDADIYANGSIDKSTATPVDPATVPGRYLIALGGVSSHFKKEVKPYEKYEIWTRVLAWDRKWIYFLSHMVRAGVVPPDSYGLQPWRKPRRSASASHTSKPQTEQEKLAQKEKWRSAIFATSVAKYVIKKGRLTIHPTQVLKNSDLLPVAPGESRSVGPKTDVRYADRLNDEDEAMGWTVGTVEAERLRGLQVAEKFMGSVDDERVLVAEFPGARIVEERGGGNEVLGEFVDLWI